MMRKKIGVVGATGSVGTQGVKVILANKDKFEPVFVTAHSNNHGLEEAKAVLGAKYSILTQDKDAHRKITDIIAQENVDTVLFAASGVSVLSLVYDIIDCGVNIALANKESIVTAGKIIMDYARAKGVTITPVDSEHSAIFQCLMGQNKRDIEKIVLTASGGPFINRPGDAFGYVIPEEALKHPTWGMGNKITIDSATMMNKGLELIEARYLFDVPPEKLDAIIHPESIVHSYVSFNDGSVIAQMGTPDMKIPIAFALGYPERIPSLAKPLNLWDIGRLSFFKPDLSKFKCLDIALKVLKSDSNAQMTIMNAANETAVMAFLKGEIEFDTIPAVIEEVLSKSDIKDAETVAEAMENIRKSNELALKSISAFHNK